MKNDWKHRVISRQRRMQVAFGPNAGIPLARMLAEQGRREEAKAVLDQLNAIRLDEWDGPETAIATQLRSDLG